MPEIIRKQEAASILGVSPFTLREWRMQGKLIEGVHYVRYNARNIRYFKEPLQHWAITRDSPRNHERYCERFVNEKNNVL